MWKKISIGLLGIATLFGGALLGWWVMKNWASIFFFSYITIGVVFAILSVVFIRRSWGTREMLMAALSPDPLWRRVLRWTFGPIVGALNWPAHLLSGIVRGRQLVERPGLLHHTASYSLQPADGVMAVSSLIMVSTVYLVDLPSPGRVPYSREMMLLILLQVVMRHVVYALDRLPLATRLRRSPGNAYLRFSAVAICDFLSLVLVNTGIFFWSGKGLPNLTSLQGVVLDLLRFRKVQAAFAGQPIGLPDIVITASGFLYYFMLLKTIFRFKEFRRNDEDILAIAGGYLGVGKYNEALKYLTWIQAPSGNLLRTKGVAYLGVNQIDKAWISVRRAEEFSKDNLSTIDYDDAALFALLSGFTFSPLTLAHAEVCIRKAVSASVSDFALCTFVGSLVAVTEFEPGGWLDFLDEKQYPLTRARLLMMENDKLDKALVLLQELIAKTSEEEVMRRLLILLVSMPPWTSAAEDRRTFEKWSGDNLSIIGQKAALVGQDYRKLPLIDELRGLAAMAEELGPHRVEELSFLINDLNNSLGEEGRKLAEFHERFLKAKFK